MSLLQSHRLFLQSPPSGSGSRRLRGLLRAVRVLNLPWWGERPREPSLQMLRLLTSGSRGRSPHLPLRLPTPFPTLQKSVPPGPPGSSSACSFSFGAFLESKLHWTPSLLPLSQSPNYIISYSAPHPSFHLQPPPIPPNPRKPFTNSTGFPPLALEFSSPH